MKSLIIGLIAVVSLQSFGATIELGKYEAKDKVSVDRGVAPSKQANFNLMAGGKATMTIRAITGLVSCSGTWSVAGDIFKANVKCNSLILPETDVEINIANVTSEKLRTAPGVAVPVMLDIFEKPETFYLMKKD